MTLSRIVGTGRCIAARRTTREGASDVALVAARRALAAAALGPQDIECIVFASRVTSGESLGSGCQMAANLGLVAPPVLDIGDEGAGFLYALSAADGFVRAGSYDRVLVATATPVTPPLDTTAAGRWETPYATGAGAAIIAPGARDARGILATGLHAGRPRAASTTVDCNRLNDALGEALGSCGLTVADLAAVVLSEAAPAGVELLRRVWGLDRDRIYAGPASLAISLDGVVRAGRLEEDDVAILLAVGSGSTWGWAVLRC